MKVLKFGGTSVANAKNIEKVKNIVLNTSMKQRTIVVVSAFGGITDLLVKASSLAALQDQSYITVLNTIEERHLSTIQGLININKQCNIISTVKRELNVLETLLEGAFLIGEITPKLSHKILGYGELLSSHIINEYFVQEGLDSIKKDSRTLIKTDNSFENVNVDLKTTYNLCEQYFHTVSYQVIVTPGFVASSSQDDATTLGRGGSDYTAAIYAAAVDADSVEIWTDVSGMFTANPKLVKQAIAIPHISYEEAMELSHFGAKVLYPPTIQPALTKEVAIYVKNTFAPNDAGTLITKNSNGNTRVVRGISHIEDISLLSLEGSGLIGIPGISKRFFEALSDSKVSVIFITQASSEHSICIGVTSNDSIKAKQIIDKTFEYEISLKKIEPVHVENDLAIIALVGDNMKSHHGLSGQMFSTLGRNNVNIRAIAQGASEKNISAVIEQKNVKKALNILHEQFFEDRVKQLNLFVMGVGNVGEEFLKQLKQQQQTLRKQLKLNIRVVALSNSKKMVFDDQGLDLTSWKELLNNGESTGLDDFYTRVHSLNMRNSIFVDNTANDKVATTYGKYLQKNISVVTCNKIAVSSSYNNYLRLKELSHTYNAPFLFETNVGAGLPIINTLNNLILSGDKINKIQAVLSGSLNFIFNNFDEEQPFHEIVKRAQKEGYTEPDPTVDLSGIDVMRKILILIRESGYKMDLEDIVNNNFLPNECLKVRNISDFYASLSKNKSYFNDLLINAKKTDSKLKYVAEYDNGKASVGLQAIPKEHPFYNLEGKDNIVLFYTDRYPDQPMIIKGAGAGADVTASGIFADIIRIGNF